MPPIDREQILDRIHRFDELVDVLVEPLRTPALDKIFYPLSSAADHSILWHVLGLTRALRVGNPAIARRLTQAMALESALTNGVIKSFFGRERPEDDRAEVDEPLPYGMRRPITSAFPSGHATAAFTAATLLGRGTRLAPAYYSLAALVSFSRVYTRMHHASDVIGGAVLGLGFGQVIARVRPLERR